MQDENITQDSLSDADRTGAADTTGAVPGVTNQEFTIKASDLKAVLGKDFKDSDSALKSIKDTFSYVGKAGQIEQELKGIKTAAQGATSPSDIAELKAQMKQVNENLWFEQNPQYKSARSLITKMGGSPQEVVETPEFKDVFTKVQGYDENQKIKTVLESNPRLASSSDKLTKARDVANRRGRQGEAAELATQSVMEAYGMTE